MKVSLQLANQYSNVDLLAIPTEELLQRIGAQLGAVEEVIDWTNRFDKALVAKVVSCHKHPNADKLSVCLIDDGQVIQDIERDAHGLVQVVCGAPNVREGQLVVWLPPGAIVPASIDKDPFVLSAIELRGVKSNGMLASAAELGISDDHGGILELQDDLSPGTAFKDLYGLSDIIIDCENKMFTHRPDCFGVLGVARELAGICGKQFISPDWYNLSVINRNPQAGSLPLNSRNDIADLVPRFMAQIVEGVKVKPSRLEVQATLSRLGTRPINNLVDISNYYMHLTAQPTHTFDYDKVKALSGDRVTIFPRLAKKGETLQLLNGKTITLTESDIVIATDKQPIALAGVMGGAATEVDETTQNIIVECATFDMYAIRRTSMRHGLFSEAVTRFNKGQSHLQNPVILQKLVDDICQDTGAKPGLLFDSAPEEDGFNIPPVQVSVAFINERLGSNLTADQIQQLLGNVEFKVDSNEGELVISPPFWRKDINLPEDIVEEVGRLYGFDKLPIILPKRSTAPVAQNKALLLQNMLRSCLAGVGANEVLSYSFVSQKLLLDAEQTVDEAYQLSNALSPELQYYRLTLTPSLLSKVYQNLRAGYDAFALFEIGKTHLKGQDVNEEGLPHENAMLSLVYAANDKTVPSEQGAAYYQARAYLEYVMDQFGKKLDFQPLNDVKYEITQPYQPGRSALVIDQQSGNYLGVVGEFKASVRRNFKLPQASAGFEIMLAPLLEEVTASQVRRSYKPLAKFPGTTQDVSFKAALDKPFAELYSSLQRQLEDSAQQHGFQVGIQPLDIYHKDKARTKHITFRLHIAHPERTVTISEVNIFLDEVVATVSEEQNVHRI